LRDPAYLGLLLGANVHFLTSDWISSKTRRDFAVGRVRAAKDGGVGTRAEGGSEAGARAVGSGSGAGMRGESQA
jgi:hypothetical protein